MVLEQQQAKGLLCVWMNSNDPSYFLNEKRGHSQFFILGSFKLGRIFN
jgi:hypothetical protein